MLKKRTCKKKSLNALNMNLNENLFFRPEVVKYLVGIWVSRQADVIQLIVHQIYKKRTIYVKRTFGFHPFNQILLYRTLSANKPTFIIIRFNIFYLKRNDSVAFNSVSASLLHYKWINQKHKWRTYFDMRELCTWISTNCF